MEKEGTDDDTSETRGTKYLSLKRPRKAVTDTRCEESQAE